MLLKCFRCFVGMFQVFHGNIAKVDRDVAYIAMIVHICCKCLFPMFDLFFSDVCFKCVYLDVLYVSHICFTHMLQIFFLDVAYVRNCFSSVFHVFFNMFHMHVSNVSVVFQVFFMCFCMCFRRMFRMFQLFRTYIAIVSFGCFKSRSEMLCMLQCKLPDAVHGEWHSGSLEGRGKHGEWREQAPLVRAVGASAGVRHGGSVQTFGC